MMNTPDYPKAHTFVRQAKLWLREQHEYSMLWNYCDARNTFHHKLLRLLGFKALKTVNIGPKFLPYLEIVKLCVAALGVALGAKAGTAAASTLGLTAIGTAISGVSAVLELCRHNPSCIYATQASANTRNQQRKYSSIVNNKCSSTLATCEHSKLQT